LKSVLVLIGKLSDRTINGELLKYLAKTANDEQPGIRTNTTICLGKIAKSLGTSSRAKVLMAAFTRSMRDPFVHARNAALMALGVTAEYFTEEDCAGRILPSVCPLLLDKEKLVRDQANKTMDVYLQKIRKAASGMPDTILPAQNPGETVARMSTPQPSEQASSSWAGWAISSFTNKLSTAAGEIQPSANGSSRPPSGAGDARRSTPAPSTSSASALARQALKSPPPSAGLPRPSPSSTTPTGDSFFPDPDDGADNGWGDMDDAGNDSFWDMPEENDGGGLESMASSTTLPPAKKSPAPARSTSGTGSAQPFGDDSEPDFAGWLAAKSDKKSGTGKPLPKGLAKPSANGGSKILAGKKPLAKPAAKPAKKIDLAPKQVDDEDEGWGDGW
jgi:SCY1-like protein 1